MAILPNTEPIAKLLTRPPTLLGLGLAVVSVAVAGFTPRDGDMVIALGMGLLFVSGALTTGISPSGRPA